MIAARSGSDPGQQNVTKSKLSLVIESHKLVIEFSHRRFTYFM